MRVVNQFNLPRVHFSDVNAQFFMQFTRQSLCHGFARFQFAAWKLPVTSIRFALGPRGDQEASVGLYQDTYRYVDGLTVCPTVPFCCGVGNQRSASHDVLAWRPA